MDVEDELIPDPDSKGFLDITNRAWTRVDLSVFQMSLTLVTLDISYNHIFEIPPQIADLILLKELRASFNKIIAIPPEIGRCKRLRKIFLNTNRIKVIPEEIGRLEALEELVLSENIIEDLPHTISLLSNLKVLKLQNNKLKALPYEIADILTLEELNCANNANLDMVPTAWRGDTESILFTCRIHRDYHVRMEEMMATNSDLSKHSQFLEQEQLLMKDTIQELRYEKEDMLKLMSKSQAAKVLGNYNIIITTTTITTIIIITITQKKKLKREVKKSQRSHVVLSCSMWIDIS